MSSSEHIILRNKLRSISSVDRFTTLINECTLTEEDKLILAMNCLQGKSLQCIADELGWSYITIKRRHAKAIKKLGPLLP